MGRSSARRSAASDESPIHQARMLTELNAVLPDDGILVADGGFAAHWSALYWDVRRAGRHYIANRGHASIGYGVPGAIGAKLAAPDRIVAGLMGDGGLGMSIGEFETAVRLGLRGTRVRGRRQPGLGVREGAAALALRRPLPIGRQRPGRLRPGRAGVRPARRARR